MAMKITEECIACGACLSDCPTDSITDDTVYVINAATCTECKGEDEGPHCASVCPVDAVKKA